jgi:hypothetical protein
MLRIAIAKMIKNGDFVLIVVVVVIVCMTVIVAVLHGFEDFDKG